MNDTYVSWDHESFQFLPFNALSQNQPLDETSFLWTEAGPSQNIDLGPQSALSEYNTAGQLDNFVPSSTSPVSQPTEASIVPTSPPATSGERSANSNNATINPIIANRRARGKLVCNIAFGVKQLPNKCFALQDRLAARKHRKKEKRRLERLEAECRQLKEEKVKLNATITEQQETITYQQATNIGEKAMLRTLLAHIRTGKRGLPLGWSFTPHSYGGIESNPYGVVFTGHDRRFDPNQPTQSDLMKWNSSFSQGSFNVPISRQEFFSQFLVQPIPFPLHTQYCQDDVQDADIGRQDTVYGEEWYSWLN
ncbi:uncharacterized protein L203_105249 [Cryptococcus depauperatus CBS 7841]|uniref:Uncharacterized protein n=1 Tax=Cryptococcus depauperatus CBS 7841 TaxID=1295531 RepID=A0A1E3I0L5_9TREE|nr:hypothetical protein L203_05616 [Cryptococcus depauperatus CBS 7841]